MQTLKLGGGGGGGRKIGTHVEGTRLESESQMSEESVEGMHLLQMQMLHWSGISNAQIAFRDPEV